MTDNARRSLFLDRDFSLVWWAGLASWTGNLAMFVVLPVLVYERTDSPLATALTVLGGALPPVVIGQLAGVIVDRADRRLVLILTNLAMAALTTTYLALADAPWLTLALTNLVISSVGQLLGPAEHALLPELVARDRLGEGASLNALNNTIGRLLGPAAGGLLYAQLGFAATVILNAGTYLVAATLMTAVSSRRPHTPAREINRPGLRAQWVEGAVMVWGHPRLRLLIALLGIVMFGEGFVSTLLAPLVSDLIGGGAQTLGWILSAQAVGGIAGAWWASRIADRHDPLALLGVGAVASGLLLTAIFNYAFIYPQIWPAIALTAVAGIPFAIFASAQTLALQVYSPAAMRGRVFALAWGAMSLLKLCGIGIAGLAGERWGSTVINVDAVTYTIAGLIALALTRTRTPSRLRRGRGALIRSRRVPPDAVVGNETQAG